VTKDQQQKTSDTITPADLLSRVPLVLRSIVENFWFDWVKSCQTKDLDPDQNLPLAVLGYVWACSDFVARTCIRYPENFHRLLAEGFESPRSIDDYRNMVGQAVASSHNDDELMSALRTLRQQEMLRIAWRDLNQLAELEVIFHELTDCAEAMVAVTLSHLEKQHAEIYGMPLDADGEEQSLLVFAMGKMGGGELNFSSDIDLIFSFPDDGETTGRRKTSHYEFYIAIIRSWSKCWMS